MNAQDGIHMRPVIGPVEERLHHAEFCFGSYRRDLEDCVSRIERDGLSPLTYKRARKALITAVGIKGAAEVVRREYESLGEEGRRKQAEEYRLWEEDWEEQRNLQEIEYRDYSASVHEKIVRIRKGLKGSDGRPLTQTVKHTLRRLIRIRTLLSGAMHPAYMRRLMSYSDG